MQPSPAALPVQADTPPLTTAAALPWIERRPGVPYFVTSIGQPWHPIGHNESIDWPNLAGLFRRGDLPSVRRHLLELKAHGVTCLRLMLEYARGKHRYIERPVGTFAPNVVQLWDDLFALCEEVGLYILLMPFDSFFTWRRWRQHPYNQANGGPYAGGDLEIDCGPVARDLALAIARSERL